MFLSAFQYDLTRRFSSSSFPAFSLSDLTAQTSVSWSEMLSGRTFPWLSAFFSCSSRNALLNRGHCAQSWALAISLPSAALNLFYAAFFHALGILICLSVSKHTGDFLPLIATKQVHNFSECIQFLFEQLFLQSIYQHMRQLAVKFFLLIGSRRESNSNSLAIRSLEGRLSCISRLNSVSVHGIVALALVMIIWWFTCCWSDKMLLNIQNCTHTLSWTYGLSTPSPIWKSCHIHMAKSVVRSKSISRRYLLMDIYIYAQIPTYRMN